METLKGRKYILCDWFRSYPTYEEWKLFPIFGDHFHQFYVLILPMRNGNYFLVTKSLLFLLRSYPTYEEWKLEYPSLPSSFHCVLILPMRNGNIVTKYLPCHGSLVRSYPTYEEWKLFATHSFPPLG